MSSKILSRLEVGGEELEKLAKEVTNQSPETIARLKKVLGN